jgi:phosphomethylpyrimidine synthase
LAELKTLGNLTRQAWEDDLQVMVEVRDVCPWIKSNSTSKTNGSYVSEAPFYVLGPLVTDIAPG